MESVATGETLLLDIALTIALTLIVPIYNIVRQSRTAGQPAEPRLTRYRRALLLALGLDAVLVVDWIVGGRSLTMLGLDAPLSIAGRYGLILAGIALCLLALFTATARARDEAQPPADALEMLPQTPQEVRLFLLLSLVLGVSWELLFRGYLLWSLNPVFGAGGAVAVAALAYAASHGFKTTGKLIGSLISALLFTTAYALSHSLWWLIMLHAGLPIIGVLIGRRRPKDV